MTVWADVLVIVNLYVDFILLCSAKRLLCLRARPMRLLLGALSGAAMSLTSLLPQGSKALSLLWVLVSAAVMCAAAFSPLKPGVFLRALICLFCLSLGLAGAFLFLSRFFSPQKLGLIGGFIYIDLSLPMLFVFTLFSYLVFFIAQKAMPKTDLSAACRFFTVENLGRRAKIFARADSGNCLKEPFSGLPVIVCSKEAVKNVAPAGALDYMSSGDAEDLRGLKLIPFESIGGAGLLPAFRPQRVTDEKSGRELLCYIALSERPLSQSFDAIYPPELTD